MHAHIPGSPLTSITSSPLDRRISGICLPTGYLLQITLPTSGARFSHHSVESPQQQPNLSHSDFARLPTPKQKTPSETCAGLQYISSKTGISYNSGSITMDPTQYQKKKKKSHSSFKIRSSHTDTPFTKPKPLGSSNRIGTQG